MKLFESNKKPKRKKPKPASKEAQNSLSVISEEAEINLDTQNLEPPSVFEAVDDTCDENNVEQFQTGKHVYIYGLNEGAQIRELKKFEAFFVDTTFKNEFFIITTTEVLTEMKPAIGNSKHIVSDIWIEECV